MNLHDAVREATGRAVRGLERVGGGDINEAYRVQFEDESFGFVKTRADVAPGEYASGGRRRCAGSGEPGALRVPEVLGVGESVLVLDWVDEGVARRAGGVRRGPRRGPRGGGGGLRRRRRRGPARRGAARRARRGRARQAGEAGAARGRRCGWRR